MERNTLEGNSTAAPEAQPGSQETSQPITQTPEIPKQKPWFVIGISVLALFFLGTTGFFVYQNYQLKQQITQSQPTTAPVASLPPTPIIPPSPSSTLSPTPLVPDEKDWYLQVSTTCNVKFTLPPKKYPYYFEYDPNREPSLIEDVGSGRFWDFREGEGALFMTKRNATAIFASPTEASGYISGGVFVSCAENENNYNNEQLVDAIKDYNSEELGGAVGIVKTEDGQVWGKSVKVMRFEGLMFNPQQDYYALTTDKNIFIITKRADSNTESVRETTQKIFDGLIFEEP